MKIEITNLQPTFVEKDKRFFPAIDDGNKIYFFDSHIYASQQNAIDHARKTIQSIQGSVNMTVENWRMRIK